jgi:uncharacterized surface protein with fasciclin (FAS1) repeats
MKTIIDTLVADGRFTTLLAALKAGSMVHTLRAPGPYTLFAPTDDAFKRLAPGAVAALVKDVRKLQTVLTYHIVSGTLAARDLGSGEIKTVQGTTLLAASHGEEISVNGARIVQADIAVSNGAVHAIDAVIAPKSVPLAVAA